MKYVVLIEKSKTGYAAYSPDLPGCVATGTSSAQVAARMRTAVAMHIAGLKAAGERVPRPETTAICVEVAG
jgi:predicted RNase H-like HicB family nuclease